MAATYTEITREEFKKFLNKAFRGYRPREFMQRNEYVYDINLDDHVAIRVYSSIHGHGSSADVGQDAIRCVLFGTKINSPLNKKAAGTIVKRTQGWRSALLERIYSFIEEYHDKKDFYDKLGLGQYEKKEEKSQPTQPQQNKKYVVEGNTYPIKDKLKSLGFRWDVDLKKWFSLHPIDINIPGVTIKEMRLASNEEKLASIEDIANFVSI